MGVADVVPRGDLSRYSDEALRSVDFRTLPVEDVRAARDVPGLTAVVSRDANSALRAAARERGCSITALANCVVDNWLEKRDVERFWLKPIAACVCCVALLLAEQEQQLV